MGRVDAVFASGIAANNAKAAVGARGGVFVVAGQPEKVRVRRPKAHTDQMRLDFGLNEPDSEDQN